MRYIKVIFLIALFFFSMLFFIQNTELISTTISLKLDIFGNTFATPNIPVYFLILLAFVLGALFTLIYLISDRMKLSKQVKEYRQKISELEKELTSLRNIPLNDNDYVAPNTTEGS